MVDWLIKMVYYEPVEVTIETLGLAKMIFDIVVLDYRLPSLIVTNKSSVFIFKFWSSIFYFFDIKRKLFITFYPQINSHTNLENSTMKAYF